MPEISGITTEISCGNYQTCVIYTENTTNQPQVKCWGSNSFGQINLSDSTYQILGVKSGIDSVCEFRQNQQVICHGKFDSTTENYLTEGLIVDQ